MAETEKQRVSDIFKSVKHHLNSLKELRPQYEYLMIAAQGSQNYNLDLQTDEYKSDVDTIAIVLPPFENFVNNDKYVSETLILDNNEHIDVKDIRQILDIFKRQNIKYLEILFTQFRIINPRYKNEMLELLNKADMIAKSNPQKLITCTYGMSLEKLKALEHPYEGLKDKIEKYGYDGKQLHHIIRLFYFAQRYIENDFDFKYAMDFSDIYKPVYNELMDAKKSKFSLEDARIIAKRYIDEITILRKDFCENSTAGNNEDALETFFNDLKVKVFNKYFSIMFTPEEKKVKPLLLPSIQKIWVTSDLHFGHENILDFEPKRWDLVGKTQHEAMVETLVNEGLTNEEISFIPDDVWENYKKLCNHNNIKLHDEELMRRWNKNVKSDDLVFILGDLSFRRGKATNEILKRLNGRKVLVKGNHENIWMDKDADLTLFEQIVDYKEIKINGYMFCMSHYPFRVWNQKHKGSIQLFGHIHSNETTSHPMKEEIPQSYNVGVDVRDYEPVRLDMFAMTTDYYKKVAEINDEYNKLRYGK